MSAPSIYAIDFGTSNSLLAAASPDRIHEPIALDPVAPDPTILRSVLYFPDADSVFYGVDAVRRYVDDGMQGRLLRSIKKHLPSRTFVGTHIFERPMNLEDLVGAFLGEVRRRANEHFGVEVDRVLLGRPALFSRVTEDDRFGEYRLERAARLAGFRDVHFCPEPIAAARDFRDELDGERVVLVADFGGGTSDYTVLRMRRDDYDPDRDVLAIGGISIAGDVLDGCIMRHEVARHFGAELTYKVPAGNNVLTMPRSLMEALCSPADLSILRAREVRSFLRDLQRWSLGPEDESKVEALFTLVEDSLGFSLFEAIERGKRELSAADSTVIRFEYPTIDVRQPVTRDAFERASERQTAAILETLDDTVRDAGIAHDDVDIVCCTGGTARVPRIARAIRERFGTERVHSMRSFHSVIGGLAERAQAVVRAAA